MKGYFLTGMPLIVLNNAMLDMSVLLGYKHIHIIGLYGLEI